MTYADISRNRRSFAFQLGEFQTRNIKMGIPQIKIEFDIQIIALMRISDIYLATNSPAKF